MNYAVVEANFSFFIFHFSSFYCTFAPAFRGTCGFYPRIPRRLGNSNEFDCSQLKGYLEEKKRVSVLFMLFGTLFCVCLITANVLETKQLSFGPVNLTAGIIVFPVSYIINDVVCEVWGYSRTRMLIWMGFAMNFFFVVMGAIADWIPGADYWDGDAGFHQIFGLAPRIALASFIAFICGSFTNAYVMSRMKLSSGGKNFSARAILSTVFGEGVDSIIFFPLALGGVIPWEEMPSLMISQVTLKTVYEIVVLPVTIRVVEFTKKHDHEDVFDNDINYNIFNILKI